MTITFGSPAAYFALGACAFALLAGCDAPTEPRRTTVGPRPETLLPSGDLPTLTVAMYSYFPSPPNSSTSAVASVTPVEFGAVPESTWVLVTVTGDIEQRWNAECDSRPPYWPCQSGSVIAPFGSEPWDGGPVTMWANQNGDSTAINLRGQGGSNTTSAIGVKFFTAGGTLRGRVVASPKWAWDPNFGTGPFSYYLGGGYDVIATAIPSPAGVTDTGALDSLGTRDYTVQPLYDLEFFNPLGWGYSAPAGAVDWYYIPGDSVSAKGGFNDGYIGIPECHYKTTCRYTPPGPGRMQATAYVETQYTITRGNTIGWCTSPVPDQPDDAAVPPECEDKQFGGCPKILSGKVITAGIPVGGILHTFRFGGPMERMDISRVSPARYTIARPDTSSDGWWIADQGWIGVRCLGIFYHVAENEDVWVGRAWYAGTADLHMTIGPNHP